MRTVLHLPSSILLTAEELNVCRPLLEGLMVALNDLILDEPRVAIPCGHEHVAEDNINSRELVSKVILALTALELLHQMCHDDLVKLLFRNGELLDIPLFHRLLVALLEACHGGLVRLSHAVDDALQEAGAVFIAPGWVELVGMVEGLAEVEDNGARLDHGGPVREDHERDDSAWGEGRDGLVGAELDIGDGFHSDLGGRGAQLQKEVMRNGGGEILDVIQSGDGVGVGGHCCSWVDTLLEISGHVEG